MDHPDILITTYALELNPCDDATKVMAYVDAVNKSGVFKEEELLVWENNGASQGWTKTQDHFATIWINHKAFKLCLEQKQYYDSAMALVATRSPAPANDNLTHSQLAIHNQDCE